MYAGIIHVLLHRLVWGVGNKISCLLWQLGEYQVWLPTVLHRHALYGDYRVTEGCWVECESQVRVCGVDGLWGS